MPKRQLPIQADLIINRLRWEAMVDRRLYAFAVEDEAKHQSTGVMTIECLLSTWPKPPYWSFY